MFCGRWYPYGERREGKGTVGWDRGLAGKRVRGGASGSSGSHLAEDQACCALAGVKACTPAEAFEDGVCSMGAAHPVFQPLRTAATHLCELLRRHTCVGSQEYLVLVGQAVGARHLKAISAGATIDGEHVAPVQVRGREGRRAGVGKGQGRAGAGGRRGREGTGKGRKLGSAVIGPDR